MITSSFQLHRTLGLRPESFREQINRNQARIAGQDCKVITCIMSLNLIIYLVEHKNNEISECKFTRQD